MESVLEGKQIDSFARNFSLHNSENTLWFHYSQHELNTNRHNFYYFSEHFCFLLLSRQDVPQTL